MHVHVMIWGKRDEPMNGQGHYRNRMYIVCNGVYDKNFEVAVALSMFAWGRWSFCKKRQFWLLMILEFLYLIFLVKVESSTSIFCT